MRYPSVGRAALALAAACLASSPSPGEEPRTIAGLRNPDSIAAGPGGKIYITVIGERDFPGDGTIVTVDDLGRVKTFAAGLDDPKGLIVVRDVLYITDVHKVWRIDARGNRDIFVDLGDFPRPPLYLNDITHDGIGNFYVSDSGDRAGAKGAVFRIDGRRKVSLVLDGELTDPQIAIPNGLLSDDPEHLFVADFGMGYLYRYDLITGNAQRLSGGFGGPVGITRDFAGSLYLSDWTNGRIFQLSSELEPPRLISERFQAPADLAMSPDGRYLLVPDMRAGTITWLKTSRF